MPQLAKVEKIEIEPRIEDHACKPGHRHRQRQINANNILDQCKQDGLGKGIKRHLLERRLCMRRDGWTR
jgi:hypothetical protein